MWNNRRVMARKPKNRDTPGERRVRRIHQIVKARIREGGPGFGARLAEELGVSEGWIRDRRSVGSFETGYLFDVLDFIGLDPVRVIRQVAESDPTEILDPPPGKPTEVVHRAWMRLATEDGDGAGEVSAEELEKLEGMRYEDPEKCVRLALEAVERVAHEDLPRLLGLLGSAWRVLGKLRDAEHAIYASWQIALYKENHLAAAQAVQRMAYVAVGRGDEQEALRISKEAVILYSMLGDLTSMGKAFVDVGVCFNYLGHPEESILAQKTALRLLPVSEKRNRFSALQNLGRNYEDLGDYHKAKQYAQRARDYTADVEPALLAKLVWLQARISLKLRQWPEADAQLREVIELLGPSCPLETALASTERVRLQLVMGRPHDAYEIVQTMFKLVESLEDSPVASAAILELFRCGTGSLKLSAVNRARAQIKKERERLKRRSLKNRIK